MWLTFDTNRNGWIAALALALSILSGACQKPIATAGMWDGMQLRAYKPVTWSLLPVLVPNETDNVFIGLGFICQGSPEVTIDYEGRELTSRFTHLSPQAVKLAGQRNWVTARYVPEMVPAWKAQGIKGPNLLVGHLDNSAHHPPQHRADLASVSFWMDCHSLDTAEGEPVFLLDLLGQRYVVLEHVDPARYRWTSASIELAARPVIRYTLTELATGQTVERRVDWERLPPGRKPNWGKDI